MTVAEKITRAKQDYDNVLEAGKQVGRKQIMTPYLNRTNWDTAGVFSGYAWDFDNFYPTEDIQVVGAARHLFYAWEGQGGKNHKGSLKQRLEECGVVLDTSQATNLTNAFSYTHMTEIPTIDCSNLGASSSGLFSSTWGRLKSIDRVIVKEDVTFKNWFYGTYLENIRFEGNIGQDLDLGASTKLSKESIESTINCLWSEKDETGKYKVTGKTLTLSQIAVENAFGTSDDINTYPKTYLRMLPEGMTQYSYDEGEGMSYLNFTELEGSTTFHVMGQTIEDLFVPNMYGQDSTVVFEPGEYTIEIPYLEGTGGLYGIAFYILSGDKNTVGNSYKNFYIDGSLSNKVSFSMPDSFRVATQFYTQSGYFHDAEYAKPTIRNTTAWELLKASKPNWTINLI